MRIWLCALLWVGCGGDDERPPPLTVGDHDAGPDGGHDGGPDGGEAGVEAGPDGGDGGPDGGDGGTECTLDEECDDLSPCNDDVCSDGRCVHLDNPHVDRDADGHDDARCGGDDCDDSDPDVPAAVEDCNQIDDDCDGAIDEGLLRETDDVLVSAGTTRYPALEEGFGGFGVLWADATDEVWFAKLGPGGSVLDGPYDLGGPAVSDTPGDMALVATSDGFLAAWCGEDGATDRLRTVRIADGEVPDAAVEVDLPGADLCFNPSGAWSGSVAAIAWMALDGADYLPSFVILNADGTEAVAPDSDANVANDRSIDVEWLGEDFGVFFRADIGGLLADGGKYVLVGEDGVEDGVITEFDDDGAAIGADVAWGGTSGIVLWTIAGDDGIQSIGLDAAGNLDGPERAFAPSATYPSVAKGAGGILGAWVTTQPVAAPLGSAALAPTLNLSDRAASSGPPSVAADASGFGVAWSEGNAGLYFNRVECP